MMSLPSKLPDTVELCSQERNGNGALCLGVIYRMSPDQSPYCYGCGARKEGEVFVRSKAILRVGASVRA